MGGAFLVLDHYSRWRLKKIVATKSMQSSLHCLAKLISKDVFLTIFVFFFAVWTIHRSVEIWSKKEVGHSFLSSLCSSGTLGLIPVSGLCSSPPFYSSSAFISNTGTCGLIQSFRMKLLGGSGTACGKRESAFLVVCTHVRFARKMEGCLHEGGE